MNAICVRAAEAVDTKPQHTPLDVQKTYWQITHTHTHLEEVTASVNITSLESASRITQQHFIYLFFLSPQLIFPPVLLMT